MPIKTPEDFKEWFKGSRVNDQTAGEVDGIYRAFRETFHPWDEKVRIIETQIATEPWSHMPPDAWLMPHPTRKQRPHPEADPRPSRPHSICSPRCLD